MVKKGITIDQLAVMVQRGFGGVDKQFEKTATVDMVQKGFDAVNRRFDEVNKRFDKIEKLILEDHRERIEKLESKVLYLENVLNLPK